MQLLLMILLSAMIQYFFPWWSVVIIPFIIAAWKGKGGGASFWNGFLASAILWCLMAYYEHTRSGGVLTNRMSEVFHGIGTVGLLTATTWIGGLLGGLAALSGYYLRQAVLPVSSATKAKAYW